MNHMIYFLNWVFKVFWSDGRAQKRSCRTQRKSQKYRCEPSKAASNEEIFDWQTQRGTSQTSRVILSIVLCSHLGGFSKWCSQKIPSLSLSINYRTRNHFETSFYGLLKIEFFIFSENGTLKKQLNDERSKMQSKILTLEEANEKLTKENKNKKLASQQNKVF